MSRCSVYRSLERLDKATFRLFSAKTARLIGLGRGDRLLENSERRNQRQRNGIRILSAAVCPTLPLICI